ncbi:hypothetical protein FQN50_002522 [Emmonsiellopsis sp. PD_5]|nr:hypothetical protein FQN50_002522 [Emmonsiellopsis sp. PD_5]
MASTQPLKTRKADESDVFMAPAPRKRRRRTGSNGAADDCFTCASRHVKCDRRRPYCTQCLGLGGQCSGYKTTLTWGVGVASRGKLRGLSWPVSGSQQVASATVTASTRKVTRPKASPKAKAPASVALPQPECSRQGRPGPSTTTALPQYYGTNSLPSPPTAPVASYHNATAWTAAMQQEADLSSQQVSSAAAVLSNIYREGNVMSNPKVIPEYNRSTFIPRVPYLQVVTSQPLEPTPSSGTVAKMDSNIVSCGLAPWPQSFSPNLQSDRNPGYLATPQSVSLPVWRQSSVYNGIQEDLEEDKEAPSNAAYSDYALLDISHDDAPVAEPALLIPQPIFSQLIGRTPRMRYLINYYAEVISPVIVAFDSPTNPYRLFVLELAKGSETLQHAIAALSLSNLRQRKRHWGLSAGKTLTTRRSSNAYFRLTEQSYEEEFGIFSAEEQAKEETFHKAMAIKSLNAQLADPAQRRADSVLATLLVLCLFYMCDTGVAKFQSQFAGVKKLLALQGGDNNTCPELIKWYTRVFAWFDVMTATINNRDAELRGEYLDIAATGHDEWALENLAGCDARMFKTVSQLSRLNMLSQGKAVEPVIIKEWPTVTVPLPPAMLHHTSLPPHFQDYDSTPSFTSGINHLDSRTEFWREWHIVRQKLESWRLPVPRNYNSPSYPHSSPSSNSCTPESTSSPFTYLSPPSSPPPPSHIPPSNLTDISNISESFRYSALLYLERLANPHLPSSHPRIQNLVRTSIHYIDAVQADVYLLWPLFVTGAECTLDEHRSLIRQHCSGIQKDSGFVNNLSCLGLLEKIWASGNPNPGNENGAGGNQQVPTTPAVAGVKRARPHDGWGDGNGKGMDASMAGYLIPHVPCGGEGFRWRRIMELEGSDGEYIVV